MGQRRPGGHGNRQGLEGTVLPLQPGFLVQPVGQEGPQLALGIGIAPVEQSLAGGGGHEQVGALGLLGGGEKACVGGKAPLFRLGLLVQDAGQQQAAVTVCGVFVQQLGLVHRGLLSRQQGVRRIILSK